MKKLNPWLMKMHLRLIPTVFFFLMSVNSLKIDSLWKRSETSTFIAPSAEDKEILREALRLMNAGKNTLGLLTENPEHLLQLIESSTERSNQIQKFLQYSPPKPSGEQYLVLSGRNGHYRVDNFTNTTDHSISAGKDTATEDIFKLVLEKKQPGGADRVFRRITIIESNERKPFDGISGMAPRKRHQVRSLRRVFSPPRTRKKRMKEKDVPGIKLQPSFAPFIPFRSQFTSPNSEMNAALSASLKREFPGVSSKANGVASEEILIEKSLLTHLLKLTGDGEQKTGAFVGAFTLAFLLSLCGVLCVIGVLIYRWWMAEKSGRTRTLKLKGENVIIKLGDPNKSNQKILEYQPIPPADLEWQSEDGDWLSYKDLPLM